MELFSRSIWQRLKPPREWWASLSGALMISLLGLCLAALLFARAEAIRQADRHAQSTAQAAAKEMASTLALYDQSLRTVVRALDDPRLATFDADLRQSVLFDGAGRDGRFGFINALDEKGDVVADSASLVPRSGNFAGRDYFRAQRENTGDSLFVGRPFLTEPGQPTMVPISRRRVHRDGSFAGVVVGTLRLSYVADLFGGLSTGGHDTITLLRQDGTVLHRFPALPGEVTRSVPGIAAISATRDGTVDWEDPGDNIKRTLTSSRVNGLPLIVAVGSDYEDILQMGKEKVLSYLLELEKQVAGILDGLNTADIPSAFPCLPNSSELLDRRPKCDWMHGDGAGSYRLS